MDIGKSYVGSINIVIHVYDMSFPLWFVSRNVLYDVSRQRKEEEDADRHLAKTIMQNRRFSTSGQADDEYDFDGPPRKRSQKKGASNEQKATQSSFLAKRILTQQERCFYCFENPNRPRHLVVSIANFTYLMLPMQKPVVPGHCCIVTMQVCFLCTLITISTFC